MCGHHTATLISLIYMHISSLCTVEATLCLPFSAPEVCSTSSHDLVLFINKCFITRTCFVRWFINSLRPEPEMGPERTSLFST